MSFPAFGPKRETAPGPFTTEISFWTSIPDTERPFAVRVRAHRGPACCSRGPLPSVMSGRSLPRGRWSVGTGSGGGRFANLPFPVTLQISGSGASQVQGKISALLMAQSFTGRFHGEMLIFRWRNRHVGLLMEPGGDTLVHINYEGKVFQFHRRR